MANANLLVEGQIRKTDVCEYAFPCGTLLAQVAMVNDSMMT